MKSIDPDLEIELRLMLRHPHAVHVAMDEAGPYLILGLGQPITHKMRLSLQDEHSILSGFAARNG